LFSFTDAVAVLVQPLALPITVTVNVPVADTLGLAVVPPETIPVPAQLNVVPEVGAAESTTEVVVQVSVPPVALAPGGVLFSFTDAVAVLVHPFALLVTVTVKVPEDDTLGYAVVPPETIPEPDQLNVAPQVGAADNTTEVVVQVSTPPVAPAPGGVLFSFTEAVAVLVQPLALFVTVTVYVPDELTLGFAVVLPETTPGPAQLKPAPPASEAADRTTDVVVHVSVPPDALALGTDALPVTDAVAVLVHPFVKMAVTVTVYVPVAVTVGFAVVPPEAMPGPAQLKPVATSDPVEADRTTADVVQVSVPPVALAPGGVLSEFTNAVAVLVQPLAELVMVTVYVPDALTAGFGPVLPEMTAGPDQLKFVPDVVEAERTTDVVVHVSVPPVAPAPGT
jgi:hypothetical protein